MLAGILSRLRLEELAEMVELDEGVLLANDISAVLQEIGLEDGKFDVTVFIYWSLWLL